MSDSNDQPPIVPPPQSQPAGPGAPSAPSQDTPIYHGSVSMWMGAKPLFFAGLAATVGGAAAIYGAISGGSMGQVGLIAGLALFVSAAIMIAYVVLRVKSLRYKITSRLIEREQGIVFRRVDALDLARVKDVELSQTLIQRMVGIGTIEVFSSDKTDPIMFIEALPNPRPVYEQLRDAVIEISQRRGIVTMGN
jgi:membrane protein YdbS with pleckstrin-like domain